jgi:hypothetical protein
MKSTNILFKANTIIELSLATIIDGKEAQVFNDYFPKVMPLVSKLEGKPLGSFTISEASSRLGNPRMGAFFQWPNHKAFQELHADPSFLSIKGIRDSAMQFFSNGHFFEVEQDVEITLHEGHVYVLQANMLDTSTTSSLVDFLPLESNIESSYQPTQLSIKCWSEYEFEKERKESVDTYNFQLNFPA